MLSSKQNSWIPKFPSISKAFTTHQIVIDATAATESERIEIHKAIGAFKLELGDGEMADQLIWNKGNMPGITATGLLESTLRRLGEEDI